MTYRYGRIKIIQEGLRWKWACALLEISLITESPHKIIPLILTDAEADYAGFNRIDKVDCPALWARESSFVR